MKVLTQYGNPEGNKIAVIAALVGVSVEFSNDAGARSKELSKQTINQQAPIFEASFGYFTSSIPVIKFLAANNEIYPSALETRAQVDEWLEVIKTDLEKPLNEWINTVFGKIPTDLEKLKKDQADVKKFLFVLEQRLKKNPFLVGGSLTLADVSLASSLVWAFRALFDDKYRKPLPALLGWFHNTTSNPAFQAVWGSIKLAKVALEAPAPLVKVEQPKPAQKKEEEKKAAAKPKHDEDEEEEHHKKQINPLDLLPPTTFDLDEWKKLITNTKDRRSVLPTFWEKIDKQGWSAWAFHYEKAEGEGEKLVPFENLLDGFVQRMESIRRYSYGTVGIYGEVPSLELKGLLLVRGQDIPQGLIDHPQFEYCKATKLDWDNDDHRKRLEDYWSNITEGTVVDGLPVQTIRSWK
jgi:elongation factor 1-gamma